MSISGDAPNRHSRQEVATRALRESLGLPFLILLASFMGFGSLARVNGFSLEVAIAATIGIWGLPGQIVLAELHGIGTGTVPIILAVAVANARFLLMAVSFMPLMRPGLKHRGLEYFYVYLLSTFSWVAGRKVFPELAPARRPIYFKIYALVCLSGATLGTFFGFVVTPSLPTYFALGLLFLNPVFFAVVFAGSSERYVIEALLIGAILGPIFHLISPDWGLIISGIIAGTVAFYLAGWRSTKEKRE